MKPFDEFLTRTKGLVLAALWLACANAQAVPIEVAKIHVEDYRVVSDATQGGLNFIVSRDFTPAFATQDCCENEGDVRWMQLASFNPAVGGFPNRPFIDPRNGQGIGGAETGNNTPFYDITVNSIVDFGNTANWLRDGSGKYLGDGPFAAWALGNLTFIVDTVLVCIVDDPLTADTELLILGGVHWGYTNNAATMTTTALPLSPLTNTAALRTAFNTALGLDFPGWTVVENPCDECIVAVIPEPGMLVIFVSGLLSLLLFLPRRRDGRMRTDHCGQLG